MPSMPHSTDVYSSSHDIRCATFITPRPLGLYGMNIILLVITGSRKLPQYNNVSLNNIRWFIMPRWCSRPSSLTRKCMTRASLTLPNASTYRVSLFAGVTVTRPRAYLMLKTRSKLAWYISREQYGIFDMLSHFRRLLACFIPFPFFEEAPALPSHYYILCWPISII